MSVTEDKIEEFLVKEVPWELPNTPGYCQGNWRHKLTIKALLLNTIPTTHLPELLPLS